MSAISLNIKALRKQKNISQKQLADEVGVTNGSIANYENEVSEPDISKLIKICKVLGVSADELLGIKPLANYDKNNKYDAHVVNESMLNYPNPQNEMEYKELITQLEWLRRKVDEKDRLIEQLLNMQGAQGAKKERLA